MSSATPLEQAASASLANRERNVQSKRGPWRDAMRRLVKNRMAMVGLGMIVLFGIAAIFGEMLAPYDPIRQDLMAAKQTPNAEHWLGTDELGRDMFSRILTGARTALLVATFVTFIAAGIGTVIGLISAYGGGFIDTAMMRLADLLLAFPAFLLAAFINATLRSPVANQMQRLADFTGLDFLAGKLFIDFFLIFGSLAIISWSGYARLIRGQVLSLREQEFVEAARSMGASTRTILFKHILPNSFAPIVVAVSVNFGNAILAESALSYLGVGIQPPTPSWGQMINQNLSQWRYFPHLVLGPGAALALLILAFNFFGDGVADALNPRRTSRN
ncbi:MAG: ABC transporter permease [Thermomicrobiales bacterium]|nr:ABC transporter permease [Thermomicrobiales bacterium]